MTERERRAFNRGLEAAAAVAIVYAEELWQMNHHTLLSDPILMGATTRKTITADVETSTDLLIEGHGHACAAHAAQNIAEAIRKTKVKP